MDLDAVEADLMKCLRSRCWRGSVESRSECCGTTPRPRAASGAVGSATCRMPLLLFSSEDGATSARRQTLPARKAVDGDRRGVRGDAASVERQQCLPLDRPQDRHRQAQALADPTHVDTGTAAERGRLFPRMTTRWI